MRWTFNKKSNFIFRPVETVGETFVSERFAAIGSIMNVELLERLRNFITACRHFVKFDVSDEMQARITSLYGWNTFQRVPSVYVIK